MCAALILENRNRYPFTTNFAFICIRTGSKVVLSALDNIIRLVFLLIMEVSQWMLSDFDQLICRVNR